MSAETEIIGDYLGLGALGLILAVLCYLAFSIGRDIARYRRNLREMAKRDRQLREKGGHMH